MEFKTIIIITRAPRRRVFYFSRINNTAALNSPVVTSNYTADDNAYLNAGRFRPFVVLM